MVELSDWVVEKRSFVSGDNDICDQGRGWEDLLVSKSIGKKVNQIY